MPQAHPILRIFYRLLLGAVLVACHNHSFGQSLFDPSFQIGAGANDYVSSIVVQSDDKIIVGGAFTVIAGRTNAYLVRLHPDGQVDDSFAPGVSGPVRFMLQQPDGKILLLGSFTDLQGLARPYFARLLTNGVVDPTFDPAISLEIGEWSYKLGLQPDGKVLLVSKPPNVGHGNLYRLNSNGTWDDSFVQTNQFGYFGINTLLVRTNGTILVGGDFDSMNLSAPVNTAALVALDASGNYDPSFDPQLMPIRSHVNTLVELTNGGVLVCGGFAPSAISPDFQIPLARLDANLQWDFAYNPDPFVDAASLGGHVKTALLQPDGKIVVGGDFVSVGGYARRAVARLDAEGHVDPCFDPGLGYGDITGFGQYNLPYALARQSNDRILIGGDLPSFSPAYPARIARLLPQSECGAIRVHPAEDENGHLIVATFPPGGTNSIQMSTNLVDWTTIKSDTSPFLYSNPFSPADLDDGQGVFFRARKEY